MCLIVDKDNPATSQTPPHLVILLSRRSKLRLLGQSLQCISRGFKENSDSSSRSWTTSPMVSHSLESLSQTPPNGLITIDYQLSQGVDRSLSTRLQSMMHATPGSPPSSPTPGTPAPPPSPTPPGSWLAAALKFKMPESDGYHGRPLG